MGKTAVANIRLDPATKSDAERIYADLGLTLSDAVNVFLRQSILVGGFPFRPHQPRFSAETEAAMDEAAEIAAGKIPAKHYSSARALFFDLDQEEDD